VWDLASGATIASTAVGTDRLVSPMAVSPDGHMLLAGSSTERASLWTLPELDSAGDVNLAELAPGRVVALCAAWSPDWQRLSIGTAAGIVGVWRPGRPIPELKIAVPEPQTALAFSPDGRHLLLGGERTIYVADALTGDIERRLTGQAQTVTGLAFAGPGLLVSTSRDRSIRLWEWPSASPLLVIDVGERQPIGLALSPDGRWAACMTMYSGVVVWDLAYYNQHVAGNAGWNLGRVEGASPQAISRMVEQLGRDVAPAPR
jgi:WD40 repeat protein